MRVLKVVVSCLALGAMSMSATAQDAPRRPGGGGFGQPQLAPEKAKAAWELQARGVAANLGLEDAQTAAVVKAYTAARESQGAAADRLMQELRDRAREEGGQPGQRGEPGQRGGGGERSGPMSEIQQKIEALNTAEREKLHKALAASITPEQTEKALASLGTFNRQWDVVVDALAGFGLETSKLNTAIKATETYVVTMAKARDSGDREAMRTANQEARKTLLDTVKPLLSEEQFGKLEAALSPGRGGRGGPGGNRPPGGIG